MTTSMKVLIQEIPGRSEDRVDGAQLQVSVAYISDMVGVFVLG